MAANNFKQDLFRIEQELKSTNLANLNSLRKRKDIMTELYCLLHSGQSIRYFMSIFRRTGAHNASVAKDIEDYISEAWITAYERYDPDKGSLLSFLTMRIQNKIIDDERKMGGLAGLSRNNEERAKLSLISVDQESTANRTQNTMNDRGILDSFSYGQYSGDVLFEIEHKDMLISEKLYALSEMILRFAYKYPVQRWKELENDHYMNNTLRKRKKYYYYRLFYSSDMISFIKESGSTQGFKHERETMEAMHMEFTNFCTNRSVPYKDHKYITPFAILVKPLARNCDTLPGGNINLANSNAQISVPIQNEVVRGYMERMESVQISSSNISQMKRKYRSDVHEFLLIR